MSKYVISIDRIRHYCLKLDIIGYRDFSQNEWISFYNITDSSIAKELLDAKEIYWYPPDEAYCANAVRIISDFSEYRVDSNETFSVRVKCGDLRTLKIPKIIKKLKII